MKARYQSLCHNCGRAIVRGDALRTEFDNSTDRWRGVHDDCTDLRDLPNPGDRHPVVSLHQLIEEGYGKE